ncbi:MAG TPA: redoxin domain-containing protein [Verrucomicrobiota bacterium]|nr:redoxin domain-containing protein [Verrucomicrobiota bacterium]HNU49610.1 redoxin domain-containing protein [Verrucomicrobiota bacterium]
MKAKLMWVVQACLMAAVVGSVSVWGQAKVGQSAPDFSATDINGRVHRLGDYRGKIVVLEAYNLDCPACANHYRSGSIQALQGNSVNRGVVWLLVNSAPVGSASYRKPEAARKEFADNGIRATAWIDDHAGALGRLYGMKTTPHLFVIDQQGLLAYQGAIDDRPGTTGDPRTARNYVKQAVESLLAGKAVPVAESTPYGSPIKYAN